MRLSEEQTQAILSTCLKYLLNISFKVYLYGSRTKDDLKGGDIDLLIVTTPEGVGAFTQNHLNYLVELKKHSAIGQRRIDIKACTEEQLKKDEFLKLISQSMLEISKPSRPY